MGPRPIIHLVMIQVLGSQKVKHVQRIGKYCTSVADDGQIELTNLSCDVSFQFEHYTCSKSSFCILKIEI